MKKLKPCLTELLTLRAALLLPALMMHHKMQEVSLTLILYTHNKVDLFIYNPVDGKRGEGDFFFAWSESVNTQSKGKSNSELNSGSLSFSAQHAL